MSEPTLEQVKKLAEQLSPEDRIQLFNHLASLPDSGIQTGSIDPPEPLLSPEDKRRVEELAGTDNHVIVSRDTHATVFLRGRAMFQVFFYANNFRQSKMEIHSWKDATPSESAVEEMREIFRIHGMQERPEEDIIAALKKSTAEIYEAHTEGVARGLSARLGHMANLLLEGGTKIVEIANQNHFAAHSGKPRKTLEEIVRILEPFWKHIKEHMNLTPGGRQNFKHTWRLRDYSCLSVHYARLKPIWREAKKIAKAAQKSTEPTRRQRWKEEVAGTYKDEELPADLIDLLEIPQATPPADLALTHAGRICIPSADYSLKVLKEKLKHFNPARTSPENDENEGSSLGGE